MTNGKFANHSSRRTVGGVTIFRLLFAIQIPTDFKIPWDSISFPNSSCKQSTQCCCCSLQLSMYCSVGARRQLNYDDTQLRATSPKLILFIYYLFSYFFTYVYSFLILFIMLFCICLSQSVTHHRKCNGVCILSPFF